MNEPNTHREVAFQRAIYRIKERERLGLSTVELRNHIYWQGDDNFNDLDLDTIKKLEWGEFQEESLISYKSIIKTPKYYCKYSGPLTYEEI